MEEHKHTILCVDDEQNILQALKRLLRREGYRMLTAGSGQDALELLKNEEVHLIVSDQRMPEMSGTEFLAQVKERYPDVLRIILTGYTDVDSITESINKGHIYKFFLKPWNDHTLKLEIRQALEQYDLIQANKKLDQKIIEQNEQLKHINENLEALVAERTQEIVVQNQALTVSHAVFNDLPFPIIGVDCDAVVMLANKMAFEIMPKQDLRIGNPLGTSFAKDMPALVKGVMGSGNQQEVEVRTESGAVTKARISPFSGTNRQMGAIITLSPELNS